MKVLVGSKNPVKLAAAEIAFAEYFDDIEVVGMAVDAGVPDQPVNEQTFVGARNRALALLRRNDVAGLGASFCVGIEGGIQQLDGRWFGLGAVCVSDARGRMGTGTTPLFELPASVVAPLLNGEELGNVIDRLSHERDTKRQGGAVGFLSGGVLDRQRLYVQGLVVALIPFASQRLFFGGV